MLIQRRKTMKRRKLTLITSVLLVITLFACNLPGGTSDATATPDLEQTITALANPGSQAGSGETPIANPQETATPEFTATAGPTSTPSVPQVTVNTNTNCRTGPSTQYDIIGALVIGQIAEVVGKNTATGYWIIKNPDGSGNCWLYPQYATISGNTASLTEYSIPATPTPSLPAHVKNLNASISCELDAEDVLIKRVKVVLSWTDVANNEDGYRIYRDGTLLIALAANSTEYTDNTTQPSNWGAIDPQPIILTYAVEAYNGAGKSAIKEVAVNCP